MMKTIILFWLGVALAVQMNAQAYQYHPFPMDSAQWIMKMESYNQSGSYWGYPYYHRYSISGDTTIGNVLYSVVYYNTTAIGGIREDSTRKVWYYNFGHPNICPASQTSIDRVVPIGTESILYDFGLQIGEGFDHPVMHRLDGNFIKSLGNAYSELIDTDSILLSNGTYRRRLHIKTSYPVDSQSWGSVDTFVFGSYLVEGIGLIGNGNHYSLGLPIPPFVPLLDYNKYHNGLFGIYAISSSGSSPPTCHAYLHCFQDKGIGLLGANSFSACDTTVLAINEMDDQSVEIVLFPNPVQTQSTVTVLGMDFKELNIQILNGIGAVVKEQKIYRSTEITIKSNDLDSGIYFYHLWADYKLIGSGKFVVEK